MKFYWRKFNHQCLLLMTHRANYRDVICNLTGAGSILYRYNHNYMATLKHKYELTNGAQGRIKFAWSKLKHQRILLMTRRANHREVICNLTDRFDSAHIAHGQ